MFLKSKLPRDCKNEIHGETYDDTLVLVNEKIRRCNLCHDIPNKRERELWEYEATKLEELREVRPLTERHRQVKHHVKEYMRNNGFSLPDDISS